jgi:hypothetical protein
VTAAAITGGEPTPDYFDIVAGPLTKRIFVRQLDEEQVEMYITDLNGDPVDELLFDAGTYPGTPPASQTVRVWWMPGDEACVVAATNLKTTGIEFNGGGGTDFNTVTSLAAAVPPGLHYEDVVIRPTAVDVSVDPFVSRSTRLAFTSRHKVAHLVVRQVNYAIVVEDVESWYLADGTTEYSFTVKSNCPWTAEVSSDPNGIFLAGSPSTLSGTGSTAGQSFKFKLKERINLNNNSTVTPQSATVTFKSPDGLFADKPVTITSHMIYLWLAQSTYTTSNYDEHSFDIDINTNIPASALSTSVTNSTNNMVKGHSIITGPKLHVTVKENPLDVLETATVYVKWGTKITTPNVTITFPAAYYLSADGKYKVSTGVFPTTLAEIAAGYNPCPGAGSFPQNPTMEDVAWYLTNLSNYCLALGRDLGPPLNYVTVYTITWNNSYHTSSTVCQGIVFSSPKNYGIQTYYTTGVATELTVEFNAKCIIEQ